MPPKTGTRLDELKYYSMDFHQIDIEDDLTRSRDCTRIYIVTYFKRNFDATSHLQICHTEKHLSKRLVCLVPDYSEF